MEELMLKAFWSQCALCKALALHGHCVPHLCPNSRCLDCGATQLTDDCLCEQHKTDRNPDCLCCQPLDLQAHYAIFENEAVSDFSLLIDQYSLGHGLTGPYREQEAS